MSMNQTDVYNIALILAIALAAGLVISFVIYAIGKRKNCGYDWRVLWLSVSIIVLVAAVLTRTFRGR
jgi:uncharacterized membrane protein YsdA (DUF1294 family)